MSKAFRRAVLAAAVVLGLVAGGGVAWAWWTASGTATGAPPLESGTLDMTVTGPSGTLVGHGGSVTLPTLTMTNATPGSSDSEVFTVNNSGTTSFTLSATTTGQGGLGPYLVGTVRWGGTDAGATCTGGSTTGPTLAPGGQTTVCVAVAVASNAPVSAQNQSGTMLFTFGAPQTQP